MMRQYLIVVSLLLCSLDARASDWPRYRGPNGTGAVTGQDIPLHWSEKDGIVWKVAVPGQGHSCPIVYGEKLFIQSASTDGRERFLLCLATQDGKQLWQRSIAGQKSRTHDKNSLASSTPATDGKRVYAYFWDGRETAVHAFDMDGNPLWHYGLGGFISQHGPGASPIVHENRVIVLNDQDGASRVVALDAGTGGLAWEAPRRPFRACYSTPCLLEKAGEPIQLIVASTAGLTAYDPATGIIHWDYKWSFDGMPLRTVASPLCGDGLVFATGGEGPGGARDAIAIRSGGKGDVTASALVWRQRRSVPYVPTMLLFDNHLYFVNDQGLAGCVVAATGEMVWTERLGGTVTASPILVDGKILSINSEGTVSIFAAEPRFRLLGKNTMGEAVSATPAVAGHRLYVRGENHLFCIGKPHG
jgi:outer membrane protein assembly factor BamB